MLLDQFHMLHFQFLEVFLWKLVLLMFLLDLFRQKNFHPKVQTSVLFLLPSYSLLEFEHGILQRVLIQIALWILSKLFQSAFKQCDVILEPLVFNWKIIVFFCQFLDVLNRSRESTFGYALPQFLQILVSYLRYLFLPLFIFFVISWFIQSPEFFHHL